MERNICARSGERSGIYSNRKDIAFTIGPIGRRTVYTNHMHREDHSHWILSGRLELTVADFGTFVLEAGDRDVMPAGDISFGEGDRR